ncbi:cupin [Caballeronia terrestris]|uniref:Cupin n=2 Tax=Caballeronia terrestris TaxID=1226301 RepID=A0A158KKZ5_9BURK|nr:cupin [Caballeronia terrestris]
MLSKVSPRYQVLRGPRVDDLIDATLTFLMRSTAGGRLPTRTSHRQPVGGLQKPTGRGRLHGSLCGAARTLRDGCMNNGSSTIVPEKTNASELLKKLVYATEQTAPLVPGRRAFFNYRDLGVTDATDGRMRVQVTLATGVMQETGWHYHICETQFILALRGWIDLQFEDGRVIRVGPGESLSIPPGLKHNEIGISEDLELLEVSVPAKMDTLPYDPPDSLRASIQNGQPVAMP